MPPAAKSPTKAQIERDFLRAVRMESRQASAAIMTAGNHLPPTLFLKWARSWDIAATGKGLMKLGRELAKRHAFLEPFNERMSAALNGGLRVMVDGKSAITPALERLARDIWREYQITNNVVAFWPDTARPTIFHTESVEYLDALGLESLKITFPQAKLPAEQAALLPARIADAVSTGKELTVLNGSRGENFRVWSSGKTGCGLGEPRLRSAVLDLAIFELLQMAEHTGAQVKGNILRQSKKGHKIDNGPLGGQPIYFFRSAWGKKFVKHLAGLSGYSELATNFDVDMEYVFLDAAFFDKKVYAAVHERLCAWAGPLAFILRESTDGRSVNTTLMDLLRSEVILTRERLQPFFRDVLAAALGKKVEQVTVEWGTQHLYTAEMLLKFVTQATSGGLMSAPTAREMLSLDDARESERMQEAHKRPKDYTPVFEAKQGMGADPGADPGGRPAGAKDAGARSRTD